MIHTHLQAQAHTRTHTHTHTHSGRLLRRKKNDIFPFATTRTDPEIIRLSEISHTEKDKCYMIPFA